MIIYVGGILIAVFAIIYVIGREIYISCDWEELKKKKRLFKN